MTITSSGGSSRSWSRSTAQIPGCCPRCGARLAAFLELHAAAEEEIFYPALLQVGLAAHRTAGVEGETLDAIHDHNEIRDAIAAVARHQVGTDEWFGAVGAANLANSDHMAEEEREGLTDFRRLAGLQRRHQLAVAFAGFEARNFAGVPVVDKTRSPTCARWRGRSHEPDPSASAASSEADPAGGARGRLGLWSRARAALALVVGLAHRARSGAGRHHAFGPVHREP